MAASGSRATRPSAASSVASPRSPRTAGFQNEVQRTVLRLDVVEGAADLVHLRDQAEVGGETDHAVGGIGDAVEAGEDGEAVGHRLVGTAGPGAAEHHRDVGEAAPGADEERG